MTRLFSQSMGLTLAILAGSLGLISSADAEVFRWVDAQGAVTYSNQPPSDRNLRYRKVDASVPQASGMAMPSDRTDRKAGEIAIRVESLERQIEQERQARNLADQRAAMARAAYEQRLAEVVANPPAAVIPVANGPLWIGPASGRIPGNHHHRAENRMPGDDNPGLAGTHPNPPMQRFR